MSADIILDFVSKECRKGIHNSCHGKWEGMGFKIICSCKCGHNKKQGSGSMVGPRDQSGATQTILCKETNLNDD